MPAYSSAATSSKVDSFGSALGALVPDLRGRALRLTRGDVSLADDVVQDTVERALRFSTQYQPGTNLRAWALQILFSVFITRYRRARRDRNAMKALMADPCAWTMPESFAAPDSNADLTPAIHAQLAALPEGFRSAVMLVDLEEQTYREAADQLGVPVGTVMSRLHRGRKILAAKLAA
ncbi:MAG: RNA polymerase sigma factor [Polyangiaceae bacterium]